MSVAYYMIKCFRKISSIDKAYAMLLLNLAPLLVAYFIEYVIQVPPCRLCIYQRLPYWFLFFVSLVAITLKSRACGIDYKVICKLAFLAYFIGFAISFFHLGVENGWFNYKSSCAFNRNTFSTFAEYKAFIESADLVFCDVKQVTLLGATMATYNSVYNLLCIFLVYFKFRK